VTLPTTGSCGLAVADVSASTPNSRFSESLLIGRVEAVLPGSGLSLRFGIQPHRRG